MDGIGADLGILMETKVTDGIYTQKLSGYSVVASNAPSAHQGGIALFWQPNKLYLVEDWRIRGLNVLTFVLVMGSCQFYAVGCYIPPNNLSTATTIEKAWNECPRRHVSLLLGNLNVNLRSPRDKRDKQIAEVVEDVIGLTDLSRHFQQHSCGSVRGRWTWRMRRGRRWVSSQCDYVLGRATDCGKYRSVRLRTPQHHDLDHCAIITNIRAGSGMRMATYRKRIAKFPLKLPHGPLDKLCTLYKELRLDVVAPPKRAQPRNSWISAPTWGLINRRAMLRRQGKLSKRMSRLLGWRMVSGLRGDRQQQAAYVAGNIEGLLASGETKEAWQCLKGWYKATTNTAPAASQLPPRLPNALTCTGKSPLRGTPFRSTSTK